MIGHQFEDSPFFNILPKGKKTTFKNKRVGVRLLGVFFLCSERCGKCKRCQKSKYRQTKQSKVIINKRLSCLYLQTPQHR